MNQMIDFLSDMAVNPKMQEMFWESPTDVMGSVDLPERVWSGLSIQSNADVTATIVNELATHELVTVLGSAVMIDPGPDPSPDPPPPPPQAVSSKQ